MIIYFVLFFPILLLELELFAGTWVRRYVGTFRYSTYGKPDPSRYKAAGDD